MEITIQLILLAALFLFVSIVASAAVSRAGVPLLLVFLAMGMLAGEDGPGGIRFDNVPVAFLIGNAALAVILLDGGMRTRAETFRVALWPAVSLATVGVVLTAGLLGVFAAWILDLTLMQGLLLGAIVGSTDAAAVFSLLHVRGMQLKQRVGVTLEIESASNDPMAIFLTVSLIELIRTGAGEVGAGVLLDLVRQMGFGAALGIAGGYAVAWLVNRLTLETGLYPLLVLAGGLVVFGVTSLLGGSGFLAIYLSGVVLGNVRLQAAQNILRVQDGLAWLAQITMFLVLGLLVMPSALLELALPGLAVAAVLMLLARPVAVLASLLPFRFPWRDQLYISWVGLRGSVAVILALFPLAYGLEQAQLFFNMAFFVVLVSLVVQGWTLSPVARALDLQVPGTRGPVQRVNLEVPGQYEQEFVGYALTPEAAVIGQPPRRLHLPEGARVLAVIRGERSLPASAVRALEPGDYVYLLAPGAAVEALDALFAAQPQPEYLEEHQFFGDFALNGDARLRDVALMYGFRAPPAIAERTLDDYLREVFKRRPVVGDRHRLDGVELVVREMHEGEITKVGLRLAPPPH
jgi:cell volume regulation protein A